VDIASELGVPVVVKAQVLAGGRGKAGGVRVAATPGEAGLSARRILGMMVAGLPVRKVLVEEAATIEREIYLSVTVDRARGCPLLMVSAQGGVDIEEVALSGPEAITKISVDPCTGLRPYHILALAQASRLAQEHFGVFGRVVSGLYGAMWAYDAGLVEINPLVLSATGTLVAVDAKVVLDDSALFRHPDLAALRDGDEETARETEAREAGVSFVELGGEIGCMVNGAGLAMATMDVVKLLGGAPANFLDIGGGARADVVSVAVRLILATQGVKAVLINIFGGITRCDEVASGIVAALETAGSDVPIVARLVGTNEAQGRAILGASGLNIVTATDLAGAARRAIAAARETSTR
jgi:succinyl-CoA synthetase beta subunit